MIKVRQDRLNSWPLEGTREKPHGRKVIQVHVLQELLYIKLLENQWEDPLRRYSSVARAQSVTCVFNIKFLEGAWEDPHREKPFKCSKCDKSFSKSDLFFTSSYLKPMRGSTQEQFNLSAQSVTSVFNIKFLEGSWEDPHRGEGFQMLKMWQELLKIRPLKELWENQNRREAY